MPGSAEPLEEDVGVLKSGVVIAGFAPIKSKKTYYAVLCERALELHESEKSYRKRKPARHLIDLSIAFNIHNDHVSIYTDYQKVECAWDVEIVTTPKLKKPVRCEETLQNMCSRQPGLAGPKRLFYYFLNVKQYSKLFVQVALDIHNKLNMIIERESEKKKKMNNG
uniref:DDE_Tnp_1_7 domain-containing protein n=1 Tax=Heterorhabditis bacteriophora TaxID=37862 RepID=A0A1I7WPL9_HETBA